MANKNEQQLALDLGLLPNGEHPVASESIPQFEQEDVDQQQAAADAAWLARLIDADEDVP